jgi:predicted outer membrane repeat protein
MKKITILTLCLTFFLTASLYSKTVWVSAAGAGNLDGTSVDNAFASFKSAMDQILDPGDILRVVGTVPVSGIALNAKGFQYTIEGDAAGSTLTGPTTGLARMFTLNGASLGQNVTFKNIIFSGSTGSTLAGGGGVFYSNQSGVTINFEKCRFVGNSIASSVTVGGGALFLQNSTVNITDCLFKENTALSKGGAISINAGANVTITKSTFYKNSTTSTTGNLNAGALYVAGAGAVVNAYNCTFFQNTTGSTNQDYGVIRSDAGTTKIYNSLFYDNKLNNNANAAGDWGSVPSIGSTLTKSLAQRISANVTNTNSTVSPTIALASSLLTYDDVLGKVTYGLPASGDVSPIDFGSDGNDVGAWDSTLTLPALSVKDNEFAANFSVSYHATTKNLKLLRSNDDSVSLEIYNLMGAKVLSRTNASKEENINASSMQSGVYILVVKGSGNKSFSQKFVIN